MSQNIKCSHLESLRCFTHHLFPLWGKHWFSSDRTWLLWSLGFFTIPPMFVQQNWKWLLFERSLRARGFSNLTSSKNLFASVQWFSHPTQSVPGHWAAAECFIRRGQDFKKAGRSSSCCWRNKVVTKNLCSGEMWTWRHLVRPQNALLFLTWTNPEGGGGVTQWKLVGAI